MSRSTGVEQDWRSKYVIRAYDSPRMNDSRSNVALQ
jgi:hypothetical protein